MKLELRKTEDGKSKQVVIEDRNGARDVIDRLERSPNPDLAIKRAMPIITAIIAEALKAGEIVTIGIE